MKKARAIPVRMPGPPVLAICSYYKAPRTCGACDSSRLVFVCHNALEGSVRDLCKACAEDWAGNLGLTIHIRTTWPRLRDVWRFNRVFAPDPVKQERLAAIRPRKGKTGPLVLKP